MRPRCITMPSSSQRTSRSAASPISSPVTRTGPTGVDASKALPCRYWVVLPCQSRIETSLTMVNPAIASCACPSVPRRIRRPMTTPSSTSQSTALLTEGRTRSSCAPMRPEANLANSVG